jgi:long-chain fatty acid transport protein
MSLQTINRTRRKSLRTCHRLWPALGGGVMMVLLSGPAFGAGFYLDVVGTPGSLGTAGVANVINNSGPDASWTNPAGLTGVDGPAMSVGATLIAPLAKWDSSIAEAGGIDGGNSGEAAVVPSLFYAQALTDEWSFGFGFSALQGGGADYGNNFVGRYGATEVTLQGIAATWSFGYRATERLSLGFGGSLIQTQFDEKIAINQSALPGSPADGQVEFKDLDDLGVQPIVGLQYHFTDKLLFGLTYRGEFDAKLKGDVRFKGTVLPLPPSRNLKVDWTNPQWLEAGFSYKLGGGRILALSGNWQQWSEFSNNTLAVQVDAGGAGYIAQTIDRDFDDTWKIGIAFGRVATDSGWTLGAAYESSPVDDDKRTIDLPFDENWRFSAAYGQTREDSWDWSVGATLTIYGDNKIDQTSQGVRFKGDFKDFYVLYAGVTLRFL